MAIQTSIKRSFIFWNVLYIVLCGGLGAWGAYDYWVTIPAQEQAVATYEELNVRRAELEMRGVLWTLLAKKADGTITETEPGWSAPYFSWRTQERVARGAKYAASVSSYSVTSSH